MYIKDVHWDDILKQTFDIDDLIQKGKNQKVIHFIITKQGFAKKRKF